MLELTRRAFGAYTLLEEPTRWDLGGPILRHSRGNCSRVVRELATSSLRALALAEEPATLFRTAPLRCRACTIRLLWLIHLLMPGLHMLLLLLLLPLRWWHHYLWLL